MPELPEVETMVRGIRPLVEGRRLLAVKRCRCRCRPIKLTPTIGVISRRVRGRRITAVGRVAKRVVLSLDSGDAFVIEPRMTGLMLLADPPDRQHLRVCWELAPCGRFDTLWFWDRRGLGTVRLCGPAELVEQLGPARLGRDALSMRVSDWRAGCARTRRAIKVALLDQTFTAGIGNLYASEILHRAGLHPERLASELHSREITRLAAAARRVLGEAIRHEGSTLADGTYRTALSQDGRYQSAHRVYALTGKRCGTCRRGRIRRIVQAQRPTFFCPLCQRRTRQ